MRSGISRCIVGCALVVLRCWFALFAQVILCGLFLPFDFAELGGIGNGQPVVESGAADMVAGLDESTVDVLR